MLESAQVTESEDRRGDRRQLATAGKRCSHQKEIRGSDLPECGGLGD